MIALSIVFFLTTGALGISPADLSACTVTKGCLRPAICEENMCEYGATWRLVEQDEIQYIEFELFGDVKSSSGFISLVFSRDPYFVSYLLANLVV